MTSQAQQELAELLRDAKPGPRYVRREVAPKPAARRVKLEPIAKLQRFSAQLPALGGAVELAPAQRRDAPIGWAGQRAQHLTLCPRCGGRVVEELVDRTEAGGETWARYPCLMCELGED